MQVDCVAWCGGVYVGFWGPLSSVNGSIRRCVDLSEVPIHSPWKSPPRMMRWSGYVVGRVPRAVHASAWSALSCGRITRDEEAFLSRVESAL